jgi:uncharacterized membrane protein YvlD (DUF360 family)
MGFVIKTLGAAASLWVAVWIVEGFEFSGEWWQFLIVAVIMGVVNAVVKPVLKLFSLPLILLTLGLFLLVVNAIALAVVVWTLRCLRARPHLRRLLLGRPSWPPSWSQWSAGSSAP